ncbi:hypothetical protein [Chryseobacterium koreense]|uniref:Uncharacterized protein n=1 Tax=Chryseobacterium koreense CCUG 49689 TaxID=1304281 RepID=A0A0J7IV68_9FLAO|nr:hypothetical protein [Chryseobacterium koreense]KMQ70153.1 hypothetical protein ACM44_13855 [Chryseobacterium koreense CCUG 49689]MBB5333941.1 hypothetical protein [Chryseobacterium koreense]
MKEPDRINHMPIDNLKYFLNSKILMNYGFENILIFVNPQKINFKEIDNLSNFEQKKYSVNLERIIDDEKFTESKGLEGFVEIQVKLEDINTVKKI